MLDTGSKERRGKAKKDIDYQPTCPIRLDWSTPETQASRKAPERSSGKGICLVGTILPFACQAAITNVDYTPNAEHGRRTSRSVSFVLLPPQTSTSTISSLRRSLFLDSHSSQYDRVPLTFESPGHSSSMVCVVERRLSE
jgi:hypothetical protein